MSAPVKGVVRIDGASTHGWQVRVYRGGATLSRLFSDARHGGPDAAYAAAVAFRAEMEAAAPPAPPPARRLFSGNRLNQTGVTGISRTVKRDARGRPHEVYSVTWSPEPGRSRSTSYSIRRWGEDTAFRLACQKRWSEMRAVHGERYPVPSYLDLYRQKAAVDARAEARSAAWEAEREATRKRPGPPRARG